MGRPKKVTVGNYFSKEMQNRYMSVSQFKSFLFCPAKTMFELQDNSESDTKVAFLQGHYAEEALIGDLDKFKSEHPELYSSQGKTKGQLKSEFKKLDDPVNVAKQDEMFMDYLQGEHQIIRTGKIEGVPFKVMMDTLHKDRIVDLKVMKEFRTRGKSFVDMYRYDIQGAVYQAIEGNNKPFYLAALSKEKVPNKIILEIDKDHLEYALNLVKDKAPEFQLIKDGVFPPTRCGKCDYCKSTKKLTTVVTLSDFERSE